VGSARKEKERTMKRRRRFFTPVVLSLLVGMTGGLVWGGTAALADPATLVIPIAGTVDGPPERVSLSGRVRIQSRMVTDPDFGTPPAVILAIDFLSVFGEGVATGARYVAAGDQVLRRTLAPVDLVEISFPFFPQGSDGALQARGARASFSLSFDVTDGKLREAAGSIDTIGVAE
jgi:hypothetical protein